MGKLMDLGADGRRGFRTALERCMLVAAGRAFFLPMVINEEPVRRFGH